MTFNVYGQYFVGFDDAECLLFPSKKNRDWSKFKIPFRDGDVIANNTYIVIFHKLDKIPNGTRNDVVYYHCWHRKKSGDSKFKIDFGIGYESDFRFATDEEKQILFDAIKVNGYKWVEETKTLEKLIIPKFKVGDKVVKKDDPTECWYVKGIATHNNSHHHYDIVTKSKYSNLHFEDQDNWELVPNHKFKVGDVIKAENRFYKYKIKEITNTHYTLESIPGAYIHNRLICKDKNWELVPDKFDITTLKPFESRVLVRTSNRKWVAAFYSHYNTDSSLHYCVAGGLWYEQCIPYDGNEYLLNTNDDCDDFYKNW
jgi:hypothetical protein